MLKRTITADATQTAGGYTIFTVRWLFLGVTIYSAQRTDANLH